MSLKSKKTILQKHMAMAIVLFSMLFSSPLYASDTSQQLISQPPLTPLIPSSTSALTINPFASQKLSIFQKSYNAVYRFVADTNHEYLLAPLTAAITAGSLCGPWCAAGGGLVGAIDEISMYFGLTNRHHLTLGVIGLTTGHMIHPSMVSDVASIALGILLPTGILNDYGELIPTLASIATGDSNSFLATTIDELATNAGITDKHYLTCFTVGEKIATKLLGGVNPVVSNFVGLLLGTIAANYEEKISANIMAPIKTVGRIVDTYGKFMPQSQVNDIIEKQVLALAGSFFGLKSLTLKMDRYQQLLGYNFERLDNLIGPAWGGYTSALGHFAIFIFPCLIGKATSYGINKYFDTKLQHTFEDNIIPKLFSDEALSRLSQDHNTRVLIDNLDNDISTITQDGSKLITETISSAMNGVYGIGILVVSSPNLLIYSALCQQTQLFIGNILREQSKFYDEKITALHSQKSTVLSRYTDPKNSKTIMARGGTKDSLQEELNQPAKLSRKYEKSKMFWDSVNSQWWTMMSIIKPVLDQALIGYEIRQARIPFEKKGETALANDKTADLFYSLGPTENVFTIETSLDHINTLGEIIQKQTECIDEINRAYKGDQLIIQNLEIGIQKTTYVKADNLMLEMGKAYVLTGKPGSGKSLLMSKLNRVTGNNVRGTGNIYYPLVAGKKPNIVMVTQEKYFPANSSLQKVIAWPDKESNDPVLQEKQKEEMHLLLQEIDLGSTVVDTSGLGSVQNWDTILSPGQQRKIMLVSAILKKPDILILDETFDSLDAESTVKAQQMLRNHLPHALILVVDQKFTTNNGNNFYDKQLKLNAESKNITIHDIPYNNNQLFS